MNTLVKNRLSGLPLFNFSGNEFFKDLDKFAVELFGTSKTEGFYPDFAVEEMKDSYKITAELPGMELKDIEVTLNENSIVISGEKKSEKEKTEKNYHYSERKYGKFERVFNLGEEVDLEKVKAVMKNGVLAVVLPKNEKAVKAPKKIEIKEG